jgi:hypothetical protein
VFILLAKLAKDPHNSSLVTRYSSFGAVRHRARPAKAIRTGLPDCVIQAGRRHGITRYSSFNIRHSSFAIHHSSLVTPYFPTFFTTFFATGGFTKL